MKTLSSPVTTAAAAMQSGFCEVYDIYLKSAITTPFGSTATLRLTTLPAGLSFFTPTLSPEPDATQGDAASYLFWPLKRQFVASDVKSTNDKLSVTASNVTEEWSAMLDAVDWEDVYFVIRKVPINVSPLTADDCAVLFIGQVDSAVITLEQISFTLSNDLGSLATIAPRQNMHTACRFNFMDDLCTQRRFIFGNYQPGTCEAGCTSSLILCPDLGSGDFSLFGLYGEPVSINTATDIITITGFSNVSSRIPMPPNPIAVRFRGTSLPAPLLINTDYWAINWVAGVAGIGATFQVAATYAGAPINLTTSGADVVVDCYGVDEVDLLAAGAITASSEKVGYVNEPVTISAAAPGHLRYFLLTNHRLALNDMIQVGGTAVPTPFAAATNYYVFPSGANSFYLFANPWTGIPTLPIYPTSSGTAVTITTAGAFNANQVRQGQAGYWKFNTAADWGDETQGYFSIPTAQQGLANPLLKPYITFDFGAQTLIQLWRISSVAGVAIEELPRMIEIFGSDDLVTWFHSTYFEMPPVGGVLYDINVPSPGGIGRYWRICVRSRWAESLRYSLFDTVQAYALTSQNWWRDGQIKFDAATATAALQGVAARVLASYGQQTPTSAKLVVQDLPAAPAAGDTFVIERGCGRTWNACCERKNWENFGGFLDLPSQTIIR